jgi:16S rRNA processing protein RimM
MVGPAQDVPADDTLVAVGRLNGPWGVSGAVKVFSFTDPPEQIFEYQPWRTNGSPGLLRVRSWRRQGPRLVAEIDEVPSREDAERLMGLELFVPRSSFPEPAKGQFYWRDLIGLDVVNLQDEALGEVRELLDAGVHDVLVIQRPFAPEADSASRPPDHLVPFVQERFVHRVDLAARRIVVDWDPDWTDAD